MARGKMLSWFISNRSLLQRFADRLAEEGSAIHEIREFVSNYIEDQIPVVLKRADLFVDGLIDWSKVLPTDLGAALEEADNSLVSDFVDLICSAANDTPAREARLQGLTVARLRSRFGVQRRRRIVQTGTGTGTKK